MKWSVKSSSEIWYNLEAERFEIHEGIVIFYDEENQPIWIIKDWNVFQVDNDDEKKQTPDEFYENLENDEKC